MGNARIKNINIAIASIKNVAGIVTEKSLAVRDMQEDLLREFVSKYGSYCKCDGTVYDGTAGNVFLRTKDGIKAKIYFKDNGYMAVVTENSVFEFTKTREGNKVVAQINKSFVDKDSIVREADIIETIGNDISCHTTINRSYKALSDLLFEGKDLFSMFNFIGGVDTAFDKVFYRQDLALDSVLLSSKKIVGNSVFDPSNDHNSVGICGVISDRSKNYKIYMDANSVKQEFDKLTTFENTLRVDHLRVMGKEAERTKEVISKTIDEAESFMGREATMGE